MNEVSGVANASSFFEMLLTGTVLCHDEGREVSSEEWDQTTDTIKSAFQNLAAMHELWRIIRGRGEYFNELPIHLKYDGANIVVRLDLLCYVGGKPVIVDWKVSESLGGSDARLQMGLYAWALCRHRPGTIVINLRTYVRLGEQPGITFLSVHAHHRLAIFLARRLTPMRYQWAAMNYARQGEKFRFDSDDRQADGFRMSLSFRPSSAIEDTVDDTLDAWLLERYRLFLPDRHGHLLRAEVDLPRWRVRVVDVALAKNSAGKKFGLDLTGAADLCHFSAGAQARFGTFVRQVC